MAGAGGALLCRLLSGALVRGRAPPSIAVPAGPGAFRSSPALGAGLAEAQGGDDTGSGARAAPPLAVGRAKSLPAAPRCSARLAHQSAEGSGNSERTRASGSRAPGAGAQGTAEPLLRDAWEGTPAWPPAPVILPGARQAKSGQGTRPLARAASPRISPLHSPHHYLPSSLPVSLYLPLFPSPLLTPPSLRLSALRTSVCIYTSSQSLFYIFLSHLYISISCFSVLPVYFNLSPLYISSLFPSLFPLSPSLSSLPPPGAVLGATREQPWNQAFASSFAEGL